MRNYGFVLLLVLVCVCFATPARAEWDVRDGFNTSINSSYWAVESTANTTVSVDWKNVTVNGTSRQFVQVKDNASNGDNFVGLKFKTPITGNFSASITYNLVNWTQSNNLERAGIRSEIGAMERISDSSYGGEVFLSDFPGTPTSILTSLAATNNTYGRLRIKRDDSGVHFAYCTASTCDASDDWTWIYHNASAATGPVNLDFGLWSYGGSGEQKVNFDDFNLHAYDMNMVPEPVSATLLLLGGGALALARKRKK